jgi:hypothetical protein
MNPPDQLDLFAQRKRGWKPALSDLLCVLRAHGGWMTRRDLEKHGFTERSIRRLSETDTQGRIFSYPNSPGYKLFSLVTVEEIDQCLPLKTQGGKMVRKWVMYHRNFHRREGLS